MWNLLKKVKQLEQAASPTRAEARDYSQYRTDPVGYCRDVLSVILTPQQEEIARLLLVPPRKVLVRAGHAVGKSMLAACLVLWWFDTRDPGICLSTAPTLFGVTNILWKEIRKMRGRKGGFAGPKTPRLETSPEHYAQGFTARDGTSFQGHHGPAVMIVFDEAEGMDGIFWDAKETMLTGEDCCFLAIYNPTTQDAPTVQEELTGDYHQVSMSCLEHPNIAAEAKGDPPPYPSAIRLRDLESMLSRWSDLVPDHDPGHPGDVRLLGKRYRPGIAAEGRLLGRRPTRSVNTVWTEALWQTTAIRRELRETWPVQIGCDVARFGDDFTAIHARKGLCSVHHEAHNGWDTAQIASRLKELCSQLTGGRSPRKVPVLIDSSGVGAGVVDQADGHAFFGVNSGERAPDEEQYVNVRSQLWFCAASLAKEGVIDTSRLDRGARQEIARQLAAPTYSLDARGRFVVEPKDQTKKRIKRSPDDADAFNLAWWPHSAPVEVVS